MTEVISIPLNELDPSKFMFSEKKSNSWNFKDKKTGKQRTGSKTYVELYYDKPGQKLSFVLNDVKSFNGIQTTDNFKRGFMSVNLKKEKSEQVRAFVDTPVFNLAFQYRNDLIKGGNKINAPAEMRIIYDGVVVEGKDKPDGSGEKWDDQLTCTVPMKKKGQQPIVDDNLCTVEDLEGRPYAWSAIEGKNLKEVAVEVDKVVFADKIRIQGTYRLIVPEDKAAAKVTTKRRLEQKKRPHSEMEAGSGAEDSGKSSNPPPLENASGANKPSAGGEAKEPANKKARTG